MNPFYQPTVVPAFQNYSEGPYLGFLGPFNPGALKPGVDFKESMFVVPGLFPNHTAVRWTYPEVKCPNGVYGFYQVAYGNYYNGTPKTPIPPRQVNAIKTLVQTHDLMIGGNTQGFDLLIDLFLTKDAGNHNIHLFEVSVFLHSPKSVVDYFATARPLGTFTVSGVTWKAALNGTIILIMPADGSDLLTGSVDVKAMFDWLISQNVITGTEWFNGYGLGAEPTRGSGSFAVNTFAVAYN